MLEDFDEIVIDTDQEEYRPIENIPNYTTDENIDELLKTEVHICSHCGFPDVINSIPFKRREIKPVQLRLDNVVHESFKSFAGMNNLNQNAALALLIRIAKSPEVSKMLAGTFSNVSKRKGKTNRSKVITSS